MRIEGNTVHKCIHEALDYDWCNCSDQTRAELHVTLPLPSNRGCDGCPDPEALFVIQMVDSISMDNLSYACRQCVADVMNDWLWTDSMCDVDGWEIRKI